MQGAGTVALSQLFVSCAGNNQAAFYVQLLKNSIPAQVVNQFSKGVEKTQLKFAPVAQLEDLFKQLQTWQKKTDRKDNEDWHRFIPFAKSEKRRKLT